MSDIGLAETSETKQDTVIWLSNRYCVKLSNHGGAHNTETLYTSAATS